VWLAAFLSLPAFASEEDDLLIDDFTAIDGRSALGSRWTAVSDRVMGGVSDVQAERLPGERPHIHLAGEVKAVPGYGTPGFVQVGLDLGTLDASSFTGVRLVVRGDGGTYGVHLRTPAARRPWQSWRGRFVAPAEWTEIRLPFTAFDPHRIDAPLDRERLSRLSLIAVDRLGPADLRVAEVALYE
jgi:hypothetical protein